MKFHKHRAQLKSIIIAKKPLTFFPSQFKRELQKLSFELLGKNRLLSKDKKLRDCQGQTTKLIVKF